MHHLDHGLTGVHPPLGEHGLEAFASLAEPSKRIAYSDRPIRPRDQSPLATKATIEEAVLMHGERAFYDVGNISMKAGLPGVLKGLLGSAGREHA